MERSQIEPISIDAAPSKTASRVRAGLLVEAGLVPAEISADWQEAVREGEFDADACTEEVLAEDPGPSVDAQLERRSGQLLKELLMAPLATGGRSRGKKTAKRGAAMLVSQVFMLMIWGGLFLTAVLLLRLRGVSLDGFLDSMLSILH